MLLLLLPELLPPAKRGPAAQLAGRASPSLLLLLLPELLPPAKRGPKAQVAGRAPKAPMAATGRGGSSCPPPAGLAAAVPGRTVSQASSAIGRAARRGAARRGAARRGAARRGAARRGAARRGRRGAARRGAARRLLEAF